jgi:hypothetical protein
VRSTKKAPTKLPAFVRELFWDYPSRALRMDRDASLVLHRVLGAGSWDSIRWLRRTLGDPAIATFLRERRGAGLTPRQLRHWQLVLGLDAREVDAGLNLPASRIWAGRTHV